MTQFHSASQWQQFCKVQSWPIIVAKGSTQEERERVANCCRTLLPPTPSQGPTPTYDEHFFHSRGGKPCSCPYFLSALAACLPGGLIGNTQPGSGLAKGTFMVTMEFLGLVAFKVRS